jgi:methylphosphotriester-DNA--protein-cysteine methyltransferase
MMQADTRMLYHTSIETKDLHHEIRKKRIQYAGYSKKKIYGLLGCKSGKRMNKKYRVFFSSLKVAEQCGYRPCGNCMPIEYLIWKNRNKWVE